MMTELKNLIDTARAKGSFSTLIKAAEVLGLIKKYSTEGPYTVFAPLESAFEGIPDEVIRESFDDQPYLMSIINYHIVKGSYTTSELKGITALETISGKALKITVNNGYNVDSSKIMLADIECTNGVIHAIDEILIP